MTIPVKIDKIDKRKFNKGRPSGTPATRKRFTCRNCGIKLISGIDPQRKKPDGSFIGECRQCASDRIVKNRWSKKSIKEIEKEIESRKRNLRILEEVLVKKTLGEYGWGI